MLRSYALPLAKHVTARLVGVAQLRTTALCSDEPVTTLSQEDKDQGGSPPQDIADLLPFIACPLTKAPLRYDKQLGKLVCDELGVAYSVLRGVPQLVPLLGEVLQGPPDDPATDGGEQACRAPS
ncbi:hypothetical protein PLESTB_000364500 [Pleodorina starrii]|uniref:Protein preY, mitochondrial n=1 Tax=Pleodorina starrii TaxID=330485 RepID=A0A9W6BDS7_9CHLO|nr:hypothetical protein PLESTM_000030700 [Pleodorina starrii]GLC50304.1 hypothetical protein PLESTB_000364500 [Pleodorina starrii]